MIPVFFTVSEGTPDDDICEKAILRMADGDNDALSVLYAQTKTAVFAYALSVLKSYHDAEDVMHDLYVTLCRSADKYKAEGRPMAWIITITKNLCLHRLRERGHLSDTPSDEILSHIPKNEGLTPDERLILSECLSTLSDEERQILVLHAVSGFKHREIAELTELPLSTVLSKYSRAVKKLKKLL